VEVAPSHGSYNNKENNHRIDEAHVLAGAIFALIAL